MGRYDTETALLLDTSLSF